jgi:alpha-tubulin suppressor-like RCC1 family protein
VQATPAKLPWAKKVVQLSASLDGHFAAAVDATGHLYTWGAGERYAVVVLNGVTTFTCHVITTGSHGSACRTCCGRMCNGVPVSVQTTRGAIHCRVLLAVQPTSS